MGITDHTSDISAGCQAIGLISSPNEVASSNHGLVACASHRKIYLTIYLKRRRTICFETSITIDTAETTGNSVSHSPWAVTAGTASAAAGTAFSGRGGGGDFPGARRLSSQDLQLGDPGAARRKSGAWLRADQDHRGALGRLYTPSPGVIYPALTYLEEVGHSSVEQDGGRKLYSITPQGEAHLAEQRATADAILQALSRIGRRMDEVREAFAGIGDLDADASDELHRARHNLKRALRSLSTAAIPLKHAVSLRSWTAPQRDILGQVTDCKGNE